MKIYFFASQTQRAVIRENQNLMRKLLERSGAIVISNLNLTGEVAASLRERADELGQSVLDQMDALVIEGSGEDPEIGYLLAYAISARKPALYFLEKGSQSNNPLVFMASKQIPSHIIVKIYASANLEAAFYETMGRLENSEFCEAPTIKFTLRITHQIEQYLHWKTHNTKLTKADYLRKMIEDVIKKDEEYNKWRKKRG